MSSLGDKIFWIALSAIECKIYHLTATTVRGPFIINVTKLGEALASHEMTFIPLLHWRFLFLSSLLTGVCVCVCVCVYIVSMDINRDVLQPFLKI